MRKSAITVAILVLAIAALPAAGQNPQQGTPTPGQQLIRAGKLDDALALYLADLKATPDSTIAANGAGVVLDLLGRTKEARDYFQKAIDGAANPQAKAAAQRAMAMSYAFDNDCANTTKYAEMAFDYWGTVPDYYRQGEALNEAARVCIEAGAFDAAEKLYRRGQEAGLKEPDISAARVALWNYRTEHALARLAARRNQPQEAKKHVAAARAALDGNAEMAKDQEMYFPYLTGYVALYLGDAKTALADLQKANQNDPFIQVLMAQAHEKLGQKDEAMALYRKAAATTNHNPPAAFARPFAVKKLGKP